MVLLASSFDQSKFLRAEDLGQEKTLRVKLVTAETIGQEQFQKPVVWFTNHQKGLVLNKTNNRTIRGAYGDDMDQWKGKLVVVYPTMAEMRGKIVPALRVRIPPPKDETGPQPAPFTAPPTPQQQMDAFTQIKPAPTPAPEPDLAADLDDEIPF